MGPAVIGPGCKVEAGARLGEYVVLGSNVRVLRQRRPRAGRAARQRLHRAGGPAAGRRRRAVHEHPRPTSAATRASCSATRCYVGANAVLGADVKVYPFKTIEDNAVVNSSIVWESKGARSLFGRDGVSGLANVDITPELAAKVAMAYATTLRKGDTVVTSRDSSRAARMLKRAMMSGLNASGVNVLDLEVALAAGHPVHGAHRRCRRGLSVRLVDNDPQTVVVRFFDSAGADISEDAQRKIERLFHREDYRRVLPGEIGDIKLPAAGPRGLHGRARGAPSDVGPSPSTASRWSSTTPTAPRRW